MNASQRRKQLRKLAALVGSNVSYELASGRVRVGVVVTPNKRSKAANSLHRVCVKLNNANPDMKGAIVHVSVKMVTILK